MSSMVPRRSGSKSMWRRFAALMLCASATGAPLAAGAGKDPFSMHSCSRPSSWKLSHKHESLQERLESALREAGLDRYLRSKQLGVAVVDLSRSGQRYYAGVNDDMMMYAASLPKVAILLAVMREVQRGRLRWTNRLKQRLTAMITASSNVDAAWATDLVGLTTIERTVRHPALCFYDDTHGGLWMGKAYRSRAKVRRDPRNNISHGATARQAARFYTMLDERIILSRTWSRRMLELMGPPKHNHKFVGAIGKRHGVRFLARKSGTWRGYHSDSALIEHGDSRYILVGLSATKDGEWVLRRLSQIVDGIIVNGDHRVTRVAADLTSSVSSAGDWIPFHHTYRD